VKDPIQHLERAQVARRDAVDERNVVVLGTSPRRRAGLPFESDVAEHDGAIQRYMPPCREKVQADSVAIEPCLRAIARAVMAASADKHRRTPAHA
jgi:hypothetical protein